jgi:hypothetical protein
MSIQGLRTTADYGTRYTERPENWREGVLELEPNGETPLYALTAAMKSITVDDPIFHHYEEELPTYRIALGANLDASSGSATITVVDGTSSTRTLGVSAKYFKIGDILLVEHTGEQLYVSAVNSATSLTVTREFGDTSATAVDYDDSATNPNLLLVGSTFEEGSAAPEGRDYSPVRIMNYTQIFRDTLEIARTAKDSRYRTGDALKEAKRRAMTKHKASIERAFFFSELADGTRNGRIWRKMNGILNQLPADNKLVPTNNTWNMSEFEEAMERVFLYGSSEKMAYCGSLALTAMNQIARRNSDAGFSMSEIHKEYGMNVRRFETPHGVLVLKTHPQFSYIRGGTGYTAINSDMFILDMDKIRYVKFKNADTTFQDRLQTPGTDGIKAGYLTECSIQLSHAACHFHVKGLTTGAADS